MDLYNHYVHAREAAYSILKEIGAIEECDAHGDWHHTIELNSNYVYSAATARFKKLESNGDFALFHELIKTILDECSIEANCPFCEKAYSE